MNPGRNVCLPWQSTRAKQEHCKLSPETLIGVYVRSARRGENKEKHPLPSRLALRAKWKALSPRLSQKVHAGYGRSHLRLLHISLDGLPLVLQECMNV